MQLELQLQSKIMVCMYIYIYMNIHDMIKTWYIPLLSIFIMGYNGLKKLQRIDDHKFWQFTPASILAHMHVRLWLQANSCCVVSLCPMLNTLKIPLVFHHFAAWTN